MLMFVPNKPWEWCKHWSNVSLQNLKKDYLQNLKKDYLQIRVSESLWPFQTVMFANRRYCLTRLSFGLNMALQIMKAIIGTVLSEEEKVKEGAFAYFDDIYGNKDIVSPLHIRNKMAQFGSICKDPEQLEDDANHGHLWKARNLAMESWNCGSRTNWHLNRACYFFPMW